MGAAEEKRIIHVTLEVEGRVQGVGFRFSAQNEAGRIGVTGYVQNRPGDVVRLEIEGTSMQVRQMVEWCHSGPPMARVFSVREWPGEVEGYTNFRIRY